MVLIRFEKLPHAGLFLTRSQVSTSYPNQENTFKNQQLPLRYWSQDSQSQASIPCIYLFSTASLYCGPSWGKKNLLKPLKKKSISHQNASSWPAYIIRTLTSNVRQKQQCRKTEALWKIISGASPTSQTRAECNPYRLSYHKHRSGTKASKWKYN